MSCQKRGTLASSCGYKFHFSRMRREGFSFYFGRGLRRVRSTLLLCSQTVATVCNPLQRFATVCNRPQPFASDRRGGNMAVPMAISAKVVTFGGFNRRAGSFRVAGVALCDIPTCFIMYVRQEWKCLDVVWCECSPAALCLKLDQLPLLKFHGLKGLWKLHLRPSRQS